MCFDQIFNGHAVDMAFWEMFGFHPELVWHFAFQTFYQRPFISEFFHYYFNFLIF